MVNCNNANDIHRIIQDVERQWKLFEVDKNVAFDEDMVGVIESVVKMLDEGTISVVTKSSDGWRVNYWIKKAILMYFKVHSPSGFFSMFYDKIPLKTLDWTEDDFKSRNLRVVPGATIRYGSYVGKNVVVMPSFINIGSFVGDGTLIDGYAHVGSCCYIGSGCHISMYAGIGGVLEPICDNPVIIEDNCFIGAHSSITEGVVVEEGSVIASGVHISSSTKIVDRESGEVSYGRIPKGSVVVAGTVNSSQMKDIHGSKCIDVAINAAIIVKRVDDKTLAKTKINEILRMA